MFDRFTYPSRDTSHDATWSQLVDHAYSQFVEPELIQPTIAYDWPIEMSPFARWRGPPSGTGSPSRAASTAPSKRNSM